MILGPNPKPQVLPRLPPSVCGPTPRDVPRNERNARRTPHVTRAACLFFYPGPRTRASEPLTSGTQAHVHGARRLHRRGADGAARITSPRRLRARPNFQYDRLAYFRAARGTRETRAGKTVAVGRRRLECSSGVVIPTPAIYHRRQAGESDLPTGGPPCPSGVLDCYSQIELKRR